MRKKNTVVIKQRDEWSELAQFLGDMIAKYAEDMDFALDKVIAQCELWVDETA